MEKKPTKPAKKTTKKDIRVPMNMSFEEAIKLAATTVVKKKGK